MGAWVPFPLSVLGFCLFWACAGPVHTDSLCELICPAVLLDLKDTVSLVLPLPLTLFLPPLMHCSLSHECRGWWRHPIYDWIIQGYAHPTLCTLSCWDSLCSFLSIAEETSVRMAESEIELCVGAHSHRKQLGVIWEGALRLRKCWIKRNETET